MAQLIIVFLPNILLIPPDEDHVLGRKFVYPYIFKHKYSYLFLIYLLINQIQLTINSGCLARQLIPYGSYCRKPAPTAVSLY